MTTPQASTSLSEAGLLIVGIARNCEKDLQGDVKRLLEALKCRGKLSWFLVESDSSDKTLEVLASLESELPDFRFRSLGNLASSIPVRTDRLAYCRNVYLDELDSNPLYASVEFVVVADLDGVNNLVTSEGVDSCFTRSDWDVCTANQRAPYYDIWALRHPVWNPIDCLKQYEFLSQRGAQRELAAWVSAYGKMITIPESADWIPVDSAFGGLAIYRRAILAGARYSGAGENGESVCEHVPLHKQLRARGARIFINPRLINTSYTENSRQRTLAHILKRGWLSMLRRVRHLR